MIVKLPREEVVQPGVAITALAASTTTLSANDPFQVVIGLPSGGSVSSGQVIRAGGPAVTATVSLINSTPPNVAQLVTSAGAAETRTVTIAVGQSSSPGTVSAGGIEFDPLLVGTVQAQATIPGFLSTTAATQTVTVNP